MNQKEYYEHLICLNKNTIKHNEIITDVKSLMLYGRVHNPTIIQCEKCDYFKLDSNCFEQGNQCKNHIEYIDNILKKCELCNVCSGNKNILKKEIHILREYKNFNIN